MSDLLTNLGFALTITVPIVLVLSMGALLARWRIINDAFIDAGSRLAFNVTLPTLLFITISQSSFEQTANAKLLAVGLLGTLAVFLLMELIARFAVDAPRDRGAVVQAGYRANMGIVGLAYCVNAYGEAGLATASLYLALVTILYNVLAPITLSRSLDGSRSLRVIVASVGRNPLVIGILAALPFAYFEIRLPPLLLQTGEYFAQMTLPLALLCTGGSLSLKALHLESRNAFIGLGGKLILSPVLLTCVAYLAGFRGMELGIVFLMSAAPTAATAYIMARAMGGNASLTANIIVLSTIGSVLVTSLGVTVLRLAGLI